MNASFECLTSSFPWPSANDLGLREAAAAFHDRVCSAVAQARAGGSYEQIASSTGVYRQQLRYWLVRCSRRDPDGELLLWRALVKYQHFGDRRRNSLDKLALDRPVSGTLQALFQSKPDIEAEMRGVYIDNHVPKSSRRRGPDLNESMRYELFLESCKRHGVERGTFPFLAEADASNARVGAEALRRWGKRIKASAELKRKRLEQLKQLAGAWYVASEPPSGYWDQVEADGHYVDLRIKLRVESPRGGLARHEILITRLWLIALIERKSSACLGYAIAFNGANYSASDVLRAVRSSMLPWKPRSLSVTGIQYREGDGLPSGREDLAFICFDTLLLDNALSHGSELFLSFLESTVNAVPLFGGIDNPDGRPHIEGFHHILEEAGIHPLDGTTGSSPEDRRRQKLNATYCLDEALLLDLIDLLVARYNNTRASGATMTPLALLTAAVRQETALFRKLPVARRTDLLKYMYFEEDEITLDGDDPVIWWHGARYRGPALLSRTDLVGERILIKASEDLRSVDVVVIRTGQDLGTLLVERRWRSSPHSMTTRLQINRLKRKTKSLFNNCADIVLAFRRHVEDLAKADRDAQRILWRLQAEAKLAASDSEAASAPEQAADRSEARAVPEPSAETTRRERPADLEALLASLGSTYR